MKNKTGEKQDENKNEILRRCSLLPGEKVYELGAVQSKDVCLDLYQVDGVCGGLLNCYRVCVACGLGVYGNVLLAHGGGSVMKKAKDQVKQGGLAGNQNAKKKVTRWKKVWARVTEEQFKKFVEACGDEPISVVLRKQVEQVIESKEIS